MDTKTISAHEAIPTTHQQVTLLILFGVFLRIACMSFGGFMAMISVTHNVLVQRRRLMTEQDMLDGIALASALPGPMAINVIAYAGYRLRGCMGALVSVCAAVIPAFVMMVLFSIVYLRWGKLAAVGKLFMGFTPAVMAIIVVTGCQMALRSATSSREYMLIVLAATALLNLNGMYLALTILAVAAFMGWWWFSGKAEKYFTDGASAQQKTPFPWRNVGKLLLVGTLALLGYSTGFLSDVLLELFCVFAGMSLMLFGGAYVFIPLLQETVVNNFGWVTQQEFVDAVAMGQILPGPALISVVFIGHKVAGLAGAIAVTVGAFAPPAIAAVMCMRVLDSIKRSPHLAGTLRGIRAAATGMIFAAAVTIGKTAMPEWPTVAIFLISIVVLVRFRVDAIWIILPAGLIGLLMY